MENIQQPSKDRVASSSDYPEVPPQVQFLTTGGGTVHFNPNLYENGYVCLSLLGTWSGPGWDPVSSTLLQVLVSIQGLVLVEEPFFNELANQGPMQSLRRMADEYNSLQRRNTLLHAILPYISAPPTHFAEVTSTHLRLKREEIMMQCQSWTELSKASDRPILQDAAQRIQEQTSCLALTQPSSEDVTSLGSN